MSLEKCIVSVCVRRKDVYRRIYTCRINTLTIPAAYFLSSILGLELHSFQSSPLEREFFALLKLGT